MPKLLRTTGSDHTHLVLLSDDNTGTTSVDKGHSHTIVPNVSGPATPGAQMPMDPGAQMPGAQTPAAPSEPVVVETEGHGHELDKLPAVLSDTPPSVDDEPGGNVADENLFNNTPAEQKELARAIKDYRALVTREDKTKKEMREARKFRHGDQWDQDHITALDSEGRAHLVINYCGALVDLFSGYARQNRKDPRAYPIREERGKVADVLNLAMKQVAVDSEVDMADVLVFEDLVVDGRGCWRLLMDYSDDIMGRIKITRLDNAKVHFGPHKNIFAKDAEIVATEEWYSQEKLVQMYPDKKEAITKSLQSVADASVTQVLSQASVLDWGAEILKTVIDPSFTDKTTKSFKLIEVERKEFRNAHVVVSTDGSIVEEVRPDLAKKAKTIPDLKLIKAPRFRVRRTVLTGQILFEDFYPDIPFSDFTILCAHAYLPDDGHWYGKIRAAKDPQKEVNKRHSQVVDIMNKCAGYGRWYDDDTFQAEGEEARWKEHGGKPGFVGKVRDLAKIPLKEEGTKLPAEVFKLEEVSIDQFYKAVNVSPAMFGAMEAANESGKMAQIRQRASLVGNEFLFDNFQLSRRRVWKYVVAMMKEYYSPERLSRLAIATSQRNQEPMTIGGVDQNPEDAATMQAITQILESLDITDFDVTIADGAMGPTTMEAERMMWQEFSQYNPGVVPPALIVSLSSLGNKDKWAKIMEAQAKAAADAEQAKARVDIVKAGRGTGAAMAGTPQPGGQTT